VNEALVDLGSEYVVTLSDTATLDVHANYWNPSEVISYAMKYAKTDEYYDFVFYQDLDGFHINSLSELMASTDTPRQISFKYSGSHRRMQDIQAAKNISYFNLQKSREKGSTGKTSYKYDLTSNTFSKLEETYNEMSDKYTTLGRYQTVPEDFENNSIKVSLYNYNLDVQHYKGTIINQLNDYNMVINVGGSSSRRVGKLVDMKDVVDSINQQEPHPTKTGKWIVLGICHVITGDAHYEQTMKIAKNGFFTFEDHQVPLGGTNP
jgi:hypothetical protein